MCAPTPTPLPQTAAVNGTRNYTCGGGTLAFGPPMTLATAVGDSMTCARRACCLAAAPRARCLPAFLLRPARPPSVRRRLALLAQASTSSLAPTMGSWSATTQKRGRSWAARCSTPPPPARFSCCPRPTQAWLSHGGAPAAAAGRACGSLQLQRASQQSAVTKRGALRRRLPPAAGASRCRRRAMACPHSTTMFATTPLAGWVAGWCACRQAEGHCMLALPADRPAAAAGAPHRRARPPDRAPRLQTSGSPCRSRQPLIFTAVTE